MKPAKVFKSKSLLKNQISILLVIFSLISFNGFSQSRITVEATSDDISNNLDLQAVASIFGESKNLEDFEQRLNDYDTHISNLDLNRDGEVDYLRVVESIENGTHIIEIQDVLGVNMFQNIATIVVERRYDNNRSVVQVIGDPYVYGPNYIIEPVYVYRPPLFSVFWNFGYVCWNSPFYWGYYPRYYRPFNVFRINMYYSHVHTYINAQNRYYYGYHNRLSNFEDTHRRVARNDYALRNPNSDFRTRNSNVVNRRSFDNSRPNNTVHDRFNFKTNDRQNSGYNDFRNINSRSIDRQQGNALNQQSQTGRGASTTQMNQNQSTQRQDNPTYNRQSNPNNNERRTSPNSGSVQSRTESRSESVNTGRSSGVTQRGSGGNERTSGGGDRGGRR